VSQLNFDVARFLEDLLTSNPFIPEADLARVAYYLVQEGAPLNEDTRGLLARHPEAHRLLDEWTVEVVKEPEGT
jgi:hypothetical protein